MDVMPGTPRLLKRHGMLCMALMVLAACTLVEERTDRAAGGPNVPADTTVDMPLEKAEYPEALREHTPQVSPGPLQLTVAEAILKAIQKHKDVLYVPWYWRWIMVIIRAIPERVFKRMSL